MLISGLELCALFVFVIVDVKGKDEQTEIMREKFLITIAVDGGYRKEERMRDVDGGLYLGLGRTVDGGLY